MRDQSTQHDMFDAELPLDRLMIAAASANAFAEIPEIALALPEATEAVLPTPAVESMVAIPEAAIEAVAGVGDRLPDGAANDDSLAGTANSAPVAFQSFFVAPTAILSLGDVLTVSAKAEEGAPETVRAATAPQTDGFAWTPDYFDYFIVAKPAWPVGPGITELDFGFGAKGGVPGSPGGGGGGGDTGGGGSPGVLGSYTGGAADGAAGYDVWIEFKGTGWTVDLQKAFIDAADYFSSIITADIGGGGTWRGKTIDDIYIKAELATIDGEGGILGQAGPQAVWTANSLTAAGVMQFDVADAAYYLNLGLWNDIVIHEMMHVLGFGTLWEYGRDLLNNTLVNGSYQYTGATGNAYYPGDALIPVEANGGSGTAGGHWDEDTLNNELMTGYIDNPNYLSDFSVMSLDDLGYVVDYTQGSLVV